MIEIISKVFKIKLITIFKKKNLIYNYLLSIF